MSNRRFELPGIHDLTKEQERVRLLPFEGQHLIVGGPGTGKSILALLRARRLKSDQKRYVFLVFNHLLKRANEQLFDGTLESKQWQSWFIKTFQELAGSKLPRKAPSHVGGFAPFDWDRILDIVDNLDSESDADQARCALVIDEGQDMPRQFYAALASLDFVDFFVVADQNQQITDTCSSRKDIANELAIEPGDVIELRVNFRNSFGVAKLARHFYTDDPGSPAPDLPGGGEASTPMLYSYKPSTLGKVAFRIVRRVDRNPNRLIGVIAPNGRVRNKYFEALCHAAQRLDNPMPRIKTFHTNNRSTVTFDHGGILVIAVQACKGLEFDEVFCADIDEFRPRNNDLDATRKQFYVMVARARDRVFMLRKLGAHCPVNQILPTDRSVLQRMEAKYKES